MSGLGADWTRYFAKALTVFLHGGNPYKVDGFFNPVHLLPLIAPFSLIHNHTVLLVVFSLLSVASYAILGRWLRKKPIGAWALILNPFVLALALSGNIDWVVWFGLEFPFWIALFFFAVKPQISMGVVAYLTAKRLSRSGILHTALAFVPVTVVLIATVTLYGLPDFSSNAGAICVNRAWMFTLPLGIGFVVASIVLNKPALAVAAGPMMSPHVCGYSYAPIAAAFDGAGAAAFLISLWVVGLVAFLRMRR